MQRWVVWFFVVTVVVIATGFIIRMFVIPETRSHWMRPPVAYVHHVYPSVELTTDQPLDLDDPPITIDGVPWEIGWRLLVRAQKKPCDNGIYLIRGLQELVRAPDMTYPNQVVAGKVVFVNYGDQYAHMSFTCKQLKGPPDSEGFSPVMFQPTMFDMVSHQPRHAVAVADDQRLGWHVFGRGTTPWRMHQQDGEDVVLFQTSEDTWGEYRLLIVGESRHQTRWICIQQTFGRCKGGTWEFRKPDVNGHSRPPSKPIFEVVGFQPHPPTLHVRVYPSERFPRVHATVVCS